MEVWDEHDEKDGIKSGQGRRPEQIRFNMAACFWAAIALAALAVAGFAWAWALGGSQ